MYATAYHACPDPLGQLAKSVQGLLEMGEWGTTIGRRWHSSRARLVVKWESGCANSLVCVYGAHSISWPISLLRSPRSLGAPLRWPE